MSCCVRRRLPLRPARDGPYVMSAMIRPPPKSLICCTRQGSSCRFGYVLVFACGVLVSGYGEGVGCVFWRFLCFVGIY